MVSHGLNRPKKAKETQGIYQKVNTNTYIYIGSNPHALAIWDHGPPNETSVQPGKPLAKQYK